MKKMKITAKVDSHPFVQDPARQASEIADNLADFLDWTTYCDNIEDYLDSYDVEHLQGAMDALYFFAQAYATDNPETHR